MQALLEAHQIALGSCQAREAELRLRLENELASSATRQQELREVESALSAVQQQEMQLQGQLDLVTHEKNRLQQQLQQVCCSCCSKPQ